MSHNLEPDWCVLFQYLKTVGTSLDIQLVKGQLSMGLATHIFATVYIGMMADCLTLTCPVKPIGNSAKLNFPNRKMVADCY